MAHLPVQCQNCGAKYKIPDTFKSDSAKCKSCGNLIDVKSVRDASDAPAAASAASASPKRATGGTRKPRQTAISSRKRGGAEEEEAAPKKTRRATASAGAGRRSRRGGDDEDGEGEERRHYEKKKDNTALISIVAFAAVAVVGVIGWMMFGGDGGDNPTGDGTEKVAEKPGDTPSKVVSDDTTGKENEGDAAKDKQVAEGDAAKSDEAKAAEAAAAKKKAADAAAKKKKKGPVKKVDEIKTAADVYKPSSEFEKFPRPAGVSEADEAEINGWLDDLRTGSGLAAIRAPAKLEGKGVTMIPLAANRLLELDYSKAEDAQYAFMIGDTIKRLTQYRLGFQPIKSMDPFDLKEGHENAIRAKAVCQMTKLYWHSEEGWKKYKKKHADKFK